MKHSIIVTIERHDHKVVISNDKGVVWEFPFRFPADDDASINGVVADIASAMLTGTIASQLKESNSPTIKYTLSVETK
jgi:hypothetical protein